MTFNLHKPAKGCSEAVLVLNSVSPFTYAVSTQVTRTDKGPSIHEAWREAKLTNVGNKAV